MSQTIPLPILEPKRAVRAEGGPFLRPEGRVLATLEEDGRRRWLRPKPSPGGWWKKRLLVAWFLIALSQPGNPGVADDVVSAWGLAERMPIAWHAHPRYSNSYKSIS